MINLSTISIYKKSDNEIIESNKLDESSILGPSKFIGEKLIEISGLNYINLRLPGILNLERNFVYRPWLKKIIFSIKKNKKIKILNKSKKFNSLIDTKEIFDFIKYIISKKKKIKGTYNLSASNPIELFQIIKLIINFYNYSQKIKFKSTRINNSAIISLKKIKIESKFKISSTKKILTRYLEWVN